MLVKQRLHMQKLSNALLSLVVLTYLLIVWGAIVRTTGSGLGCPDWPLCHGQIIPPFQADVLIEYTHRLLASAVGLLTLGICIAVWKHKEWCGQIGKFGNIALVLLFVQVLLGGVTVKSELHPQVVATHWAVALLFFTILILTTLKASLGSLTTLPKTGWYKFSHALVGLLYLQMILGSLVSASNAGLACPDFPTCQGAWLPMLQGEVALHFFHRVGAFIISAMTLVLITGLWKKRLVKLIFALVLMQVLLGIGNVLYGLPLWMRLAHTAVAVLLFATLIVNTYALRRNPI